MRSRRVGSRAMCKIKNCNRPSFTEGLCGFHALQGYYRAHATPGVGLTASRVVGKPNTRERDEEQLDKAAE